MVNVIAPAAGTRHRGFDLLRVIAMYMVMQIHTGELEYISATGTVLHTPGAWGLTLLLPFIHLYFPAVWGEAFWMLRRRSITSLGYRVCGAGGLCEAIFDGAFASVGLAGSRHGCCGLCGYGGRIFVPAGWRLSTKDQELTWNYVTLNIECDW